jgi:hypothetical protein
MIALIDCINGRAQDVGGSGWRPLDVSEITTVTIGETDYTVEINAERCAVAWLKGAVTMLFVGGLLMLATVPWITK